MKWTKSDTQETLWGIIVVVALVLFFWLSSCSSTHRAHSELRGLMLLDNKQLSRNKEYYSKHNQKIKRDAFRKHKKSFRY